MEIEDVDATEDAEGAGQPSEGHEAAEGGQADESKVFFHIFISEIKSTNFYDVINECPLTKIS